MKKPVVKVSLKLHPLNKGGYDRMGAYFGNGGRIYDVVSDCGRIDIVFRLSYKTRGVPRKIAPPRRKNYARGTRILTCAFTPDLSCP